MTAAARKRTNGQAAPNTKRRCAFETRPNPIAVFIARAEARALLWQAGEFDLHEAVDVLWDAGERDGLVDELGQDRVQAIIAKAFEAVR